jgi:hypothetical protein
MKDFTWTYTIYKAEKSGVIICAVYGVCLACLLWEARLLL